MWDLISAAWISGFAAIRRNLTLFIFITLLISVIEFFLQPRLPAVQFGLHHYENGHAGPIQWHSFLITLIGDIVSSIVVAPCMVAVHRHILLEETGKALSDPQRLLNFSLCLVAVRLFPRVADLAIGRLPGWPVIEVASYFLMVRLVLSFPAIAIGSAFPFRESWRRSEGHWWRIFWTMVLGVAPIFVLISVLVLPFALRHENFAKIAAASIFQILEPIIVAALASELYRNYIGSNSPITLSSSLSLEN